LQDKDPTIADLLKPLGYTSAQIGKNHLGDRNEYLPTVHGFDEFYGILYHLNAMEEPYDDVYPKTPGFHAQFGPRNIVDAKATTTDDPTTDPRWGKVGKQTIADGGGRYPRTQTWTRQPRSTWRMWMPSSSAGRLTSSTAQ